MIRRWGLLTHAFALALACVATAAGAVDFVDHYKVGLTAIESEDWELASDMMSRAIELHPQSKARIKKALFFKRYMPHFYLGLSLSKLGDCEGALSAWQEAEAQGVVQKSNEYPYLVNGRETCTKTRLALEASQSAAESRIAAARVVGSGARQGVEDLQTREIEGVDILYKRLEQAESQIAEAEALLALSDPSLGDLEKATKLASTARDGFKSLDLDISRWLQSMATEQLTKQAELNQRVAVSFQRLKSTEYLAPYPPRIEALRAQVEGLIAQVGELDPSAASEEITQLTTELSEALAALEETVVEPPQELQTAARAYLTGNYAQVIESLGEITPESARVSSQIHLLQAAALYALFRTDGGSDPELLEQARQEVVACHRLPVTPSKPSPRYFSPSFVEFFESQRANKEL